MASVARLLRYVWAAPNTAVGLIAALAALTLGASAQVVDGVLELSGPGRHHIGLAGRWLGRCRFDAITLGHVVLAVDARAMRRWRQHERVHVRQCERWGPLFLPLYLGSSFWAWWRGGRAYYDNRFEREACARQASISYRPDRRAPRRK